MDDDDSEKNKNIKRKTKKINALQRYVAYVSNVLLTTWVRCTIQANDGTDRFVLGCRRYLLFNFRMFLVVLYLTYEILK